MGDGTVLRARRGLRARSVAARRGLELAGLSLATLFTGVLTVLSLAGMVVGLVSMACSVIENGRDLVDGYRRAVRDWAGVAIPRPYRATPARAVRDSSMRRELDRLHDLLADPATWRDLVWMLVNPVVAIGCGLLPPVGICYAWGLLVCATAVRLVGGLGHDSVPTSFGDVLADPTALLGRSEWVAIPAGLALCVLLFAMTGPLLRVQVRFAAVLLSPTGHGALAERVAELTETRAHASDVQAAELRRIERDLHDGAQARLVAVGMTLRTVERLLDTDPAAVRALVAEARETSAAALQDLRELVRGVHPPVLAERGLADALRAVALDTPLPVTVTVGDLTEPEPPLAAAVYFGVSEVLANAAKHAGAGHATLTVVQRDGTLAVTVTDDGHGGARVVEGGGLDGVRRRLATFDGTLTVAGPQAGPTAVTLEIPCVSSSPKTSTSSARGWRGC